MTNESDRERGRARPTARGFALLILVGFGGVLGCGAPLTPITDCDARGSERPLCGFHNAEDLALVPGGRFVLVSEFGSMEGGTAGRLSRLDLSDNQRSVLFRPGDAAGEPASWGDSGCPGPPDRFSPHGIDLARRPDGSISLLVVQHDGRESVEIFEVLGLPGDPALAWRGCVVAPAGAWFNDVAALPDGGFVVSNMMPRRDGELAQMWEMLRAGLLGHATGHVLEWDAARGFRELAGSATAFPNGVAVSRDGASIYVNSSGRGEVFRLSRATGKIEAKADVPAPDNSAWSTQGQLVVASFTGDFSEMSACQNLEAGQCPAHFEIVELDPVTLERRAVLYRGGPDALMGAGTVGLRVGDELLIGSFGGDRILRVSLSPPHSPLRGGGSS